MCLSQNDSSIYDTSAFDLHAFPACKPSGLHTYILEQNNPSYEQWNRIPGLLTESASPYGSRRLSVRGIRPFPGIKTRNMSIYWNGIPLSDAAGYTDIDILDPMLTDKLTLMAGPTPYSAGTGGLILIHSKIAREEINSFRAGFNAASNGMQCFSIKATSGTDHQLVSATYINRTYDGFRNQGYSASELLNLIGSIRINTKSSIELFANYFNGGWGLPGGLDSITATDEPTSIIPFVAVGDTREEKKDLRAGITYQYRTSKILGYTATFFFNTTQNNVARGISYMENSYNVIKLLAAGSRISAVFTPVLLKQRSVFVIGMEVQNANNNTRSYENINGEPGNLKDDYNNKPKKLSIFAQSALLLPHHVRVKAGAGLHFAEYGHFDLFVQDTIDGSYIKSFTPCLSPEINLTKSWKTGFSVYAQASYGYNLPAPEWTEVQDGQYRTNAEPAYGWNAETGIFTHINEQMEIHLDAYLSRLYNSSMLDHGLDAEQHNIPTANSAFKGLEASLILNFFHVDEKSLLRLWSSMDINDHKFTEYLLNGNDYSGNVVAGFPLYRFNTGMRARTPSGLKLEIEGRHTGKRITDDSIQTAAPAYTLWNCSVGFSRFIAHSRVRCDAYAGVNNLLNLTYSSWLDINNPAMRYFYPYEKRAFFCGLQLHYYMDGKNKQRN